MKHDVPQFFKEMIIEQYGKNISSKIINGYENIRYVTLRVNTIKACVEEIKKELIISKIEYENVPWFENAIIIKNVREDEIRKLEIYEKGKIYLQSLSSMIPPIILEAKQGENILDMAAAPGGKTTQIAAMTNNRTMITACEKNKIRAEKLKYNLEKQGAGCVNIMLEDARKLDNFFSFDKILLDAPCSGSGTYSIFNKNFTTELIDRSAKLQKELLSKALKILKSGQEMVYSTCSILQKENEDILNAVLPNFKAEIIDIKNLNTQNIPLLPTSINGTICVCPTNLFEGFFVAKIKKS